MRNRAKVIVCGIAMSAMSFGLMGCESMAKDEGESSLNSTTKVKKEKNCFSF